MGTRIALVCNRCSGSRAISPTLMVPVPPAAILILTMTSMALSARGGCDAAAGGCLGCNDANASKRHRDLGTSHRNAQPVAAATKRLRSLLDISRGCDDRCRAAVPHDRAWSPPDRRTGGRKRFNLDLLDEVPQRNAPVVARSLVG